MTKNPEVVHPEDRIEDVSEKMTRSRLQQLPVVDEGKLVGIITTYDLWRDTHNLGHDRKVKEVMNRHVIKIAPKDKVGTAAELFMDKRFKSLPVVNLRNELKGVITAFDVIKHILKKEYAHPILYNEVLSED